MVADADGQISDPFTLPDWFVATYAVVATGTESGTATTTFTDGNVASATIAIRESTCTTAQTNFVGTSTVCAHVVATIQGGGSTAWAIHWYAPGVSPASGPPAHAVAFSDPTDSSTQDDSFTVSTNGTWTVVVCKTGNLTACSSGNTVRTATFTVTSCAAPAVTTDPVAQSITYGANATFTAAASGTPTPSVQWQVSSNGGSTWTNVAGATSTSLTLTTPAVSQSGNQYRAVFTNTCSGTQTATSNAASLTVAPKPITITPNSGQSKIYGAADPTLTFTNSPALLGTDTFSGALSRAAGENVGAYAISLGTLSAGANYALSLSTPAVNFTINLRPATWTTDPNSKTYGNVDPSPLTTGSGTGFLAADGVTATYSRATGESVAGSPYHITATLSSTPAGALANYTITNLGADFTINLRPATWTTDPNSKTYGNVDPSPLTTGSGTGFLAADGVTATYSRAAGETVAGGPYHITATLSSTPAGALANYTITNLGADFTINLRPATWTTDPNSKTYGNVDPSPLTTGSGTGFLAADGVTATYSRAAGETVAGGPYHITATLSSTPAGALANYTITNLGADFTINLRPATWTTDPNSKTYGNVDPSPLTTGSGTGFLAADGVTATYSRAAGESRGGQPVSHHRDPQLDAGRCAGQLHHHQPRGRLHDQQEGPLGQRGRRLQDLRHLDPAFGWTYSGFITGEDETNVTITGDASCTRTRVRPWPAARTRSPARQATSRLTTTAS